MEYLDAVGSPLFPQLALSADTGIKLPPKPLCHSGSVQLYLILAEKILYLQGFEETENKERPPLLLRGSLFLRITKPVKIKAISLKFCGTAKTEWPEGIPPKKTDFQETNQLISHTWPFFNASNSYPDNCKGANIYKHADSPQDEISSFSLEPSLTNKDSSGSLANVLRRAASPSPIRSSRSRSNTATNAASSLFGHLTGTSSNLDTSVSNNDLQSIKSVDTIDSSANKNFVPGDYIYNFELPVPSSTPESMSMTFGSVQYVLEASVERSGTFKTSLLGRETVTIVRTPADTSLEENEPIAIVRDWEDRLRYEIVIASKAVVLNTYLPLAFKLTPLEKIQLHRVRVYITENLEYYCRHMKVHRLEPTRKYLLLEHKPGEGKSNLLGDEEITARELEFQLYVPEKLNEKQRLHPDTSYSNMQAHHWIKICLRLSKSDPTPDNPQKRKHYEISIDSPIHVLSPLATHANTLLPSYNLPQPLLNYLANPPLSPNVIPIDNSLDAIISSPIARATSSSCKTPILPVHHHTPTILQNIEPDYHVPVMNLGSNLYKPENLLPELQSPQAQPFSPMISPEMAALSPNLQAMSSPQALSLANSPSIMSRPIHLLRRPSVDPPPFDADVAPPAMYDDEPPAYQEKDMSQPETDFGGSFEFSGLSPNLPNAILRATSPAPPASRSRSASRLRNTITSTDLEQRRPHVAPVAPVAPKSRRTIPHTAESLLNDLNNEDETDYFIPNSTDPEVKTFSPGVPTVSLSPTNLHGSVIGSPTNLLSPTSSIASSMRSNSTHETLFDPIGEPLLNTNSTSTNATLEMVRPPQFRGRMQSVQSTDLASMYSNAAASTSFLQQLSRSESIWHPIELDFASSTTPHIFRKPTTLPLQSGVADSFKPPQRPERQMSFGVEETVPSVEISAPDNVPSSRPASMAHTHSVASVTTSMNSEGSGSTLKSNKGEQDDKESTQTGNDSQLNKLPTTSSRPTLLEQDTAF